MNNKKNDKPRNWVVSLMRERTKPGPMKDRKKEADKRKCRGRIKWITNTDIQDKTIESVLFVINGCSIVVLP